ncbi:hypothetical protein BDZ94DRAFT_1248588 [Collybia nuda]|uniref:Uncharacterized protein n=1 Tax=Collybia nuda TaxID=64659 RepID=A0A9P5YE69_9AGAR|nr:hypothetical protein BDZ94DRAFT_1248588 [Collybia nuda]
MAEESNMVWKNRIDGSPRPFNLVNTNLMQIGCIPLDRFLSSKSDAEFEEIRDFETGPTIAQTPPPLLSQPPAPANQPSHVNDASLVESQISALKMQNVARLYQACQSAFGNTEALIFDYTQENGSQSKQCILTITRPNGSVRAYKTEPIFTRKTDAKAHAANIAVDMAALEFIASGDSEVLKQKKGLLLSSLDAADPETREEEELVVEPSVDDGPVKVIESCCVEWRAGAVRPHWVEYQEPQNGQGFGAALRIQLAPHSSRVYSTDTVYGTNLDAKIGCANVALQEGVLDYIKHGNGQTEPAVPSDRVDDRVPEPLTNLTSALSLQAFYETLPQPFPEPVADKTASEINAPVWLNTLLQSARGARLKPKFIWMMGVIHGLHGCILRLERPDAQCRSYYVDPRFQRRADAKAAVCLLAMSQGIGDYIRCVGSEVENKISEYARKLANQTIYPGIIAECLKIRPNQHPEYTFTPDRDAFGCTLTVDLSSSPENPDPRSYTVKPEYRNKVDAKIAVAVLAAEQGIFELLRFRGAPPPPGYVTFWESHDRNTVSKKRKEPDTRDGGDPEGQKMKKPKLEQTDSHHEFAGGSKGAGKKPLASGSSGLVSLGVPAQKAGRSGGQHQHGHRSAGHSGAPPHPSHFSMGPSSFPHPGHLPGPGIQPGVGMVHSMHYTYQYPPQHVYGASQHPPGINQYIGATPYPQMVPPTSSFYPGYIQAYGTVPPTTPYNPYPHQYQQYQFIPPGPSLQPYNSHSDMQGPSPLGLSATRDHPDHFKTTETPLDYGNGGGEAVPAMRDPSHQKKPKRNKAKAKRDKVGPVVVGERLSATITDAETPSSRGRSSTVDSGQTPVKSYFNSLTDFCAQEKKPYPHFYREAIFGETGTRYKVWIEMGSERLELQNTFETINDGRERLARQVLNRLRRAK